MTSSPQDSIVRTLLSLDDKSLAVALATLAQDLSQDVASQQGFETASTLARILGQGQEIEQRLSRDEIDDMQQVLLEFILKTIRNLDVAKSNSSGYKRVVEILLQHNSICSQAINICLEDLRDHVTACELEFRGNAITSAHHEVYSPKSDWHTSHQASEGPTDTHKDDRDHGQRALPILQALTLLKVLAWRQHSSELYGNKNLYNTLLSLSGTSSEAVAISSQETLFALISCTATVHADVPCPLSSVEIQHLLWSRIYSLCVGLTKLKYNTFGFSLWASIVSLHPQCFPPVSILQDAPYWAVLQHGLAHGTVEQRKTCLFILKLSVASLDDVVTCPSVKEGLKPMAVVRNDYARFSTLYDTIVLARYFNQVQDCLVDLTNMVRKPSHVRAEWFVSLLFAALGVGMQDSIRQLLGNWTMSEQGITLLQQAPSTLASFLLTRFLPWATIGSHFTSSVASKMNATFVCRHGEHLIHFLEQIINTKMECETRKDIVQGVINFTKAKGAQMFSFARVYLLQGLLAGVETAQYQLDTAEIQDVVNISSFSGFNEMSRDLMALQCENLVRCRKDGVIDVRVLQPLLGACASLKENAGPAENHIQARQLLHARTVSQNKHKDATLPAQLPEQDIRHDPLGTLRSWIQASHHQCIAGPGLQAVITYIQYVLDECEEELEVDDLASTLHAAWEEFEVQQYPKHALMSIPRIFFHAKCVKLSKAGTALRDILSIAMLELQKQCHERPYACWPFYSSLRRAILRIPEASNLLLVDLCVEFANNPPRSKIDFDLEAAIAPFLTQYVPFRNYHYYYGESLGYGYACIFDMLNKLPKSAVDIDTRKEILIRLLQPWLNQSRPPPISSKWKTSTQLQMMLVLLEGILPGLSTFELNEYIKNYNELLALEPMPRYRYLLEWMLIRMYMLRVEFRQDAVHALSTMGVSNPKHVVSLIRIVLVLVRLPNTDAAFALAVMTEMTTLAASPKIAIRHEAQWTIPVLWTHCETRQWHVILENPAFARLNSCITSSEIYKNPPAGRLLANFDLTTDHTLSNLFEGSYLDIEPSEPPKLTRQVFLKVWDDDGTSGALTEVSGDTGMLPLGASRTNQPERDTPGTMSDSPKKGTTTENSVIPLQTKASTWQDLDPAASRVAVSADTAKRKTKNIIVVASLIDNPYNIGGLSRVSEIFGVKALLVANTRVIDNKDFTAVSVASQYWLPIEELKVDALAKYFVQQKLDGYTVVGIEQTDKSKILGQGDWYMPEKVVLVLGSEREGIPAELLAHMDICVEVKQVGFTRSMNVQTAAAVALYEYSRQYP